MIIPEKCGHGRSFKERCIECELVSANEGLANARENLNHYGKVVAKLEAEKRWRDAALTTSQRAEK